MAEDTGAAGSDLDAVVEDSVADAQAPAESGGTSEAAPAAAAGAEAPSGFSDDDFKTFGLEPQGPREPGQRENRIPYSRVRSIVENARKKLHRDFEANQKKDAELRQTMEARLQQMDAIGQIMQSDPARFLQMLQQVNPAYAQYQLQQAVQQAQQQESEGQPEPDLDLGNGYRTYSPQGLQRLLEYQAGQIEARLQARYQPLEENHRQQQILSEAGQRVNAQISDAMTWPHFEQHAPEILAALQQDTAQARARGSRPTLTLEAAYRQVVFPKLAATRDQMRTELLKEIQQAPTSTAAPAAGTGAAGNGGPPRSLDDVVYDAIRARGAR